MGFYNPPTTDPASNITIGIPVIGGTVFGVLWEDASGNLASGPLLSDTTGNLVLGAGPVRLTSPAAANLQLGAASVDTAPVAQKLSVQNTLAGGTSNVAGANFTIAGSQGKGTGVGGSLIFQIAPAGSTGTVVNALATALTIDSTKLATFGGDVSVPTANGYFFGSVLSSSVALVHSGALMQASLADRSDYAALGAAFFQAHPNLGIPAGGSSVIAYKATSADMGVFFGSGVPTISAAQGSIYLRSDGSTIATRLYVNTTGSTVWTNFVSAA